MHVSTNMAGMTMAFPNVCLTPAPPAPNPVPIPYPSIGQCATAMAPTCALRVKILNKNVLTVKTKVMKTQGDEPGVGGGVTSGMFGGPCARTQSSMKLNVEGSPVVRNLDVIGSNGASPNAPVGNQLVPSQTVVICLGVTAAPSALRSESVNALIDLLGGGRIAVLTGAGCSTESGIPDYRGPETRRRARNPIRFSEFVKSPEGRQRYWARAFVGWERFRGKAPNPAHHALASMERDGRLAGLITQNVDRLHHAAGSSDVVELHGALADVRCLECGLIEPRDDLQARLDAMNPGWRAHRAEMAPDGDAELPLELVARFTVAGCGACGGALKPDVVFFGEGVPRERVERAYGIVDAADALLVVGSSLAVFSGYRFVKRAHANGQPIAIVNLGESRGDSVATVRVSARAGDVLPRLAEALRAAAPRGTARP